ncbi:MAG: isochorismate synthase MenF [Bradymonadia bacterium]
MDSRTAPESFDPQRSFAGDALVRAVHAAAQRAQETGHDTVLRVHRPLHVDPFEGGQGAMLSRGEQGPVFTWSDPRDGLDFTAMGVVARTTPRGRRRFEVAQQVCTAWRRSTVEAAAWGYGTPAEDLPMAVMWFAFADEVSGHSMWRRWPRAEVILPRRVLYRRRGHHGPRYGEILTVPVRIDQSTGAVDVEAAIREVTRPFEPLPEATHETVGAEPIAPGAMDPHWHTLVEAARAAITSGQMGKVVLARSIEVQAPEGHGFDPVSTSRALRGLDPEAVAFGVQGTEGAFIGATPEVLFRARERWLSTHALAGTAPLGETAEQASDLGRGLMASAKDRHEHALVVDALVNALGPYCESVEAAPRPRLRRSGKVQHLETPVSGRLAAGASLISLLGRMHPTPALGGVPRGAALKWLATHEGWDRGPYGGPVGWVAPSGDAAFAVAIRSALLQGPQASLFVGAGLVADSEAAGEWQETAMKARTVGEALRLRPLKAHVSDTPEDDAEVSDG